MALNLYVRQSTIEYNPYIPGMLARYNGEFQLIHSGSGTDSYLWSNLRVRSFWNHHFAIPTNPSTGGYFNVLNTTLNWDNGVVESNTLYQNWKNNVYPPKINTNNSNFCSEVVFNFTASSPTAAISSSAPNATGGLFTLQGVYGAPKYNNYYDVETSFSYISSTNFVQNPSNYLLEYKLWSKGISSLSLNQTTLTITTSTPHTLQVNDAITINGNFSSTEYSSSYRVVSVISPTQFTIKIKTYSAIPTYSNAYIEYWVVLAGQAPSSAVAYNYDNSYFPNPNPSLDNHLTYTWLIYSDKDTTITATNDIGNNVDYSSASILPVQSYAYAGASSTKKLVVRFPVSSYNIPVSSGPFTAEIDFQNAGMYEGNQTFNIYQMTSDAWPEASYWNTINPMISSTVLDSQTIGPYYNLINLYTYLKFDVSNYMNSWLAPNAVTDVALVKTPNLSFSDNYWVSSSATTEPEVELWPYIVISATTGITPNNPPSVTLTDTNNTRSISSISGNGLGVITVNTSTAHGLSNGDLIGIVNTVNYNTPGVSITVVDSDTFTITISGNTATGSETSGNVLISDITNCVAQGVDAEGMSNNPSDLMVKKTSSLTSVTTTVISSSATTVNFGFTLDTLADGYYQIQVNDTGGLSSSVIKPPIITQYLSNPSSYILYPLITKSGSLLYFRGFNVNSFTSYFNVVMGSTFDNGLITGGISNSVSLGSINVPLNQFSTTIPSGLSNEWSIGVVNYTNNTIQLLNAPTIQLDMPIVFNCNGNIIQPLQVGTIYYVNSVSYSGANSTITLSETLGGADITLTAPTSPAGITKAYNKYFPVHVEKDGYVGTLYNNILSVPIDDFGPAINIPNISGVGETITIVISDPSGISQSQTIITNGTINGTPVDLYGNGCVLQYSVTVTSVGQFVVIAYDNAGNSSTASQTVIVPNVPTIFVTGYTITSPTSFNLTVKVVDDNTPAQIATTNSGQGVFVQSNITNVPYGTITSINAVSDGVVFQLSVSSLGAGVMKIYATDSTDITTSITPPVITSLLPTCGKTGTILTFKGVNLANSPEDFDSYEVIQSSISNTQFQAKFTQTVDGTYLLAVKETIDSRDFISNPLPFQLKNTPPTINIIGSQILEVEQYSGAYVDQGATATDGINDLTNQIVTTGVSSVDTTKLGTYVVNYTVSDGCGNTATANRIIKVVTGCTNPATQLIISVYPSQAVVGDVVRIQADNGSFNSIYTNNVVTFNDVISEIVGGDTTYLEVLVPLGAATGNIIVETFNQCIASAPFVVLYEDILFDTLKVVYNDNKRKSTTTVSYSVFNPDVMKAPVYNIDYSYSYFTPIVDENSMVQNVLTIVLTGVGERIFNPGFGTTIRNKLFGLVSTPESFENEILSEISDAVTLYEPRVTILIPQSFVMWDEDTHELKIVLAILVPTGSVRKVGLSLKNFKNAVPT